MLRTAIIDTGTQGLGIDVISQGQGKLEGRTHAPYGVALELQGGVQVRDGKVRFEITADALAEVGRFFLAAAVHCGQDIR